MTAKPRVPAGLGTQGAAFFRRLMNEYDFEVSEIPIVEMAARQAEINSALEQAISKNESFIEGSKGQKVLNPAIAEVRLGRVVLARLLAQLPFPDEDDIPRSAKSEAKARAANSRWGKVRQLREVPGG